MIKEIKKAINNETRTHEGIAGKNYFVNQVDYDIKISFNPETRIISGTEVISYKNNSKDTLDEFVLNLYQNIFKKGNARDWAMGDVDITDGVKINKIVFAGNEIDVNSRNEVYDVSSLLIINAKDDILPNSSTDIQIDWELKLPGTVHLRGGRYEKENFFVSYWFPKVAVYDDIYGWNKHGHTGVQEFYNDFGNYNVEITVPKYYNVWTTAILQNSEELFTEKYLERIKESKSSDKIVNIITKEDREKNDILKKSKINTWKFKSEHTPDFAFAISKTYLWDATSYMAEDKRVSVNAVYKQDSEEFTEVAEITKNVIKFFSEEIPAVPYPYPQITVFNGGGGMEFPGMVNDGNNSSRNGTLYLTSHEVGHSYFPFYTGLNEQKYAWMDEGLITFYPQLFVKKYTNDSNYSFFTRTIASYNHSANSNVDLPLMIPSDNLSRYPYRFQAYTRSSIAFNELYNLLGKEKFTEGLQLFIKNWNGKHPTPYDFFNVFNTIADEDLAWFWKPWFFQLGSADLSVGAIVETAESNDVEVVNVSGFPVRIKLKVIYNDGSEKDFEYSSRVWKSSKRYLVNVPKGKIRSIILDTTTVPDAFPENNILIIND